MNSNINTGMVKNYLCKELEVQDMEAWLCFFYVQLGGHSFDLSFYLCDSGICEVISKLKGIKR